MPLTENDIRQKLKVFSTPDVQTLLAVVTELNTENFTCTLSDNDVEYYNVRLCPITGNENGFIIIPKIGSFVIASQIEDSDQRAIVLCSQIDKIIIKVGNMLLEFDKNGLMLNKGTNGAVKTDVLIDWIASIHSDLKNLIEKLNKIEVAGNGAVLGLNFIMKTAEPIRSDFENTAFKH